MANIPIPVNVPIADPKTGLPTIPYRDYLLSLNSAIPSSQAPSTSTYIVRVDDPELDNAQVLGNLSTGFVKVTTGSGLLSSSGASTITTGDITDSAITTAKILDFNVTNAKLSYDVIDNTKLQDSCVSLENLDSGIYPSHICVFAGTHVTVGGSTAETINLAGVVGTDIATVMVHTRGGTPITVDSAATGTDTIGVTMSGNPGTDHVLSYIVMRAAS